MMLPSPASTASAPNRNSETCCRPAVPPPPVDGAPTGANADGLGDGDGLAEGVGVGVGVTGRAEPEPDPEPGPLLAVPEPGALAVKNVPVDPLAFGVPDPVQAEVASAASTIMVLPSTAASLPRIRINPPDFPDLSHR